MMPIEVEFRPPSELGRLWPRYDKEAGIIEVSSEVPREWPFGVNIGASVVFDLDAQGILANFDILIPKKRWKKRPDPGRPIHSREADLEFNRKTLEKKTFTCPVTISADAKQRHLIVTLQESTPEATAITLSERCFAYVRGRELVGFYLVLDE